MVIFLNYIFTAKNYKNDEKTSARDCTKQACSLTSIEYEL